MKPTEPPFDLHRAFISPISPALELGAVSGATGLLGGGVAGIFTSAHPTVFAAVSGAQCFLLGTTFFYCRGSLLGSVLQERSKRKEVMASGIAGAFSGAAAGALRGRANIIPGTVMVSLMGMTGQATYHAIVSSPNTTRESKRLLDRIADARWLPLRSLSDAEYEHMLDEKVISIKAEIALIDEQISTLQQTKTDMSNSLRSSAMRHSQRVHHWKHPSHVSSQSLAVLLENVRCSAINGITSSTTYLRKTCTQPGLATVAHYNGHQRFGLSSLVWQVAKTKIDMGQGWSSPLEE